MVYLANIFRIITKIPVNYSPYGGIEIVEWLTVYTGPNAFVMIVT